MVKHEKYSLRTTHHLIIHFMKETRLLNTSNIKIVGINVEKNVLITSGQNNLVITVYAHAETWQVKG